MCVDHLQLPHSSGDGGVWPGERETSDNPYLPTGGDATSIPEGKNRRGRSYQGMSRLRECSRGIQTVELQYLVDK